MTMTYIFHPDITSWSVEYLITNFFQQDKEIQSEIMLLRRAKIYKFIFFIWWLIWTLTKTSEDIKRNPIKVAIYNKGSNLNEPTSKFSDLNILGNCLYMIVYHHSPVVWDIPRESELLFSAII